MTRLIDVVCDYHRDRVLDTRLWPRRANTCPNCSYYNTKIRLLPHHDMMHSIAVHETGHAVAYLALGIPVDAVVLRPDGTGHVEFRHIDTQPIGVWAGAAALRHMLLRLGSPSTADLLDVIATGAVGAASDSEQLHTLASDGVDITAPRETADLLVAEHWSAIEQAVSRLLSCGRLTGDEIKLHGRGHLVAGSN
ncbi:MAG TPA: hypothetical protein VFX60_19260 [Micromonospora sp.]|nr:hypothetical protein [Micromonospora sp.]